MKESRAKAKIKSSLISGLAAGLYLGWVGTIGVQQVLRKQRMERDSLYAAIANVNRQIYDLRAEKENKS